MWKNKVHVCYMRAVKVDKVACWRRGRYDGKTIRQTHGVFLPRYLRLTLSFKVSDPSGPNRKKDSNWLDLCVLKHIRV